MLSKTQLIEIGRHYFDDKSVNVMFTTSDGNFFYEASKSYADSHAKSRKIEVFEIKRQDLKTKEVEKEASKTEGTDELAELRKEAKELKIKGFAIMKADTLRAKIEKAKE